MASTSKLEDLNVTKDELKRIGDALKDENFRKLFLEYAQEISDPENRRLYEQEITQMESERGMDIQFVHPNPGHVLETSIDGKTKGFINICQNDKIEKPKSIRQTDAKGRSGMMWQIPHSFAQPRDDVDSGEKCQVFDVVFHPDTYRMSETNERFLKLVHDTAFDGIEKQFDLKIDRKNIKKIDKKYKGIAQATVIRKKCEDQTNPDNSEMSDILKKMPYPYDNKTTSEKMKEKDAEIKQREENKVKKDSKTKKLKENKKEPSKAAVPEYSITHRSDLDLQEYRNAPDARTSTRPKDLIVKIFLPLLPSSSCASLDIFEQSLKLESTTPAAYLLDIKLPYPVNEDEGSAKFDKNKRCLTVTLPVQPAVTPKLPSFIEDEKRNSDTHDATDISENENFDIKDAPKIEVLASSETQTKVHIPDDRTNNAIIDEEHIQNGCESVQDLPKMSSTPSVAYSVPEYTYNQDADTISFIFNVRNISRDTITKSFPNPNSIRISFVSLGSGCFPMYYCLYIQFDPTCRLASEHCSTDLTDANLVLVLLKDKSSRSFWDRFEAGLDASHLEEKLLLTDVSLQKQLNQLDEEAEHLERAESQIGHTPLLEVTEMKEKKLTINIKTPPLDHNEDDEYDPPSSADIEVVHRKAPPKLHSILKQRTLSESSDDHVCSGGESPRSGQEDSPGLDGQCRKSVSFNSHVDSTTYKKNTAPTSMKTALKSKRRRARKKEEKKANSRRRRNSGSEGSSGEELSQTDSVSTSDDKEENEEENDDAPFDQIAEDDEGEIEVAEGKSGGLIVGAGEGSVKAGKDNQDFRTSAFNEGSDSEMSDKKKKMMVQEIKTKLATAENPQAADSDDDDVDNPAELDERTSTDSAFCVNDVHEENVNQAVCDEVNEMSQKSESGPTSKTEESDNIVSASTISRPGDLQRVIETQDSSVIKIRAENKSDGSERSEPPLIEELGESDKGDNSGNQDSKVESMLSWKDKGEVLDPFSNGHKTQCAFSFSNSVIYDLDVD